MRWVLNADDLGASPRVNDAIARGFDAGDVTSASLLVTGAAFGDAVRRFRTHDVGVHLDAVGLPLARVEAAWLDQVARARDAGFTPTHLDSHEHLHWLPAWRPVFFAVARATGIRRIRAPGTGGRWGQPAVRGFVARRRFVAEAAGLVVPDDYVNGATAARFWRRWGTVEVMLHPGDPAHDGELAALAGLRGERVGWGALPTGS